MMKKVIMDVDTGIDDALAILYAIESEALDILGITTVNGNVPLDYVTKNTLKVLHLAGENIPVHPGAVEPYLREAIHEFKVHGNDGIGNALDDMTVTKELEDIFAADFIIESAYKHNKDLTLIMVGPLTNLALALKKDPAIKDMIGEVVIMGGVVSNVGHGNMLPTSEFNIFADAEAAKVVFHKGLDITLVSLDVTHQVMMTDEHVEKLKDTKYYDFVKDATDEYMDYGLKLYGRRQCALHDPLTVGYVLDPALLKTEKYYVDVETSSPLSYGQTICDFRRLLGKEPNVNICTGVDSERFLKDFIETLSS
ncbi:purine nucleosidase [Salinicoccus kekensis]|uniref:Purine nucleosidase n=2 Tax=Salinicoccus kekensis TaxID=714307 RepID=A0A285UPN6_9STAP|nr:purine nucleosidase [Salinicoccus kekensis]